MVFLILSIYLGGRTGGANALTLRRRSPRPLKCWLVRFMLYGCCFLARGSPFEPIERGILMEMLFGTINQPRYIPFKVTCLVTLNLLKIGAPDPASSVECRPLTWVVIAATHV